MFGEIALRPDGLCQRGNAAIAKVDLRTNPVDDDVDGEKRSEKSQDGRVDSGVVREDGVKANLNI